MRDACGEARGLDREGDEPPTGAGDASEAGVGGEAEAELCLGVEECCRGRGGERLAWGWAVRGGRGRHRYRGMAGEKPASKIPRTMRAMRREGKLNAVA